MANLSYNEQGDDRSKSESGFSFANSHSTRRYVTSGISSDGAVQTNLYLQNLPIDFLGRINLSPVTAGSLYASNTGGINRGNVSGGVAGPGANFGAYGLLPCCDHVNLFQFAETVNGLAGVGKQNLALAQDQAVACMPIQNTALYTEYEFVVSYTPRPYRLLPDSAVPIQRDQTYYKDDGTQSTGNTYAHEEVRWTDFEIVPAGQSITFKQGFMKLRGTGYVDPTTGKASDPQYPAQPIIRLPDCALKFRWYQVPYRYVTDVNSNLLKWLGRINQNPWYDLNFGIDEPNYMFPAGSLLYIGYQGTRYTPPFPNQVSFASGTDVYTTYSAEKLCDIEFLFMFTTRINSSTGYTPPQMNYINAGWNCLPWWRKVNQYYYAASVYNRGDTLADQFPTWLSFPFELLFTDPQVTHG